MIATPLGNLYIYLRDKGGSSESGDPSIDLIFHLAMAYGAMLRLEELSVPVQENGRSLVIPSLERAYREAVHIRSRINLDILDTRVFSRYGRLYDNNNE